MKRLLIAALLLCAVTSFAQQPVVPGYLGKKFYIGVNGATFMHFERDQNDQVSLGNFPLNTRFSWKNELTLNYTVSRKIAIGMSGIYGKQTAYFGIQNVQVLPPNFPDTVVQAIVPVSEGKSFGQFRYSFYMIEAHVQFFRRNFIAPAGRYHQIGIAYMVYTPDMKEPGKVEVQPLNASLEPFGPAYLQDAPKGGNYNTFRISYQMGRITPINKFIYINTAFGVNLYPGGDHREVFVNSGTNTIPTFSDMLIGGLHRNINRQNTFELKIGLGWFAF